VPDKLLKQYSVLWVCVDYDLRLVVVGHTGRFIVCTHPSGFGGLVVSMLASGTRVRGLKPGRSRRIFSGVKILSMPSFGGEVKPFAPCRRFAAR
jgi:hypothetical protein